MKNQLTASISFRFQTQQNSTQKTPADDTSNLGTHSSSSSTSLSQTHANQKQALSQALEERRRLLAMENSAPDPISTTAHHRGRLVEHRIDQLRQELANKNSSEQ